MSFRDFLLSEQHNINASRGLVKRFYPGTYQLTRAIEKVTRRTYPAFKPQKLFYSEPIYYISEAMTIVPTGTTISFPSYSHGLDFELELAWVLKAALYNASAREALDAIGAFVLIKDLSARDVQRDEMGGGHRPQVDRWAVQMIRAGGLRHFNLPDAQGFSQVGPLDLPGQPVPVATPGHTSGHTSFFLPNSGVLITGDALVTGHPTFNGVGPRLLPAYFSHDQDSAISSLNALRELQAGMFVPGHGPAWYGPISDSVDRALDQVTRNDAVR